MRTIACCFSPVPDLTVLYTGSKVQLSGALLGWRAAGAPLGHLRGYRTNSSPLRGFRNVPHWIGTPSPFSILPLGLHTLMVNFTVWQQTFFSGGGRLRLQGQELFSLCGSSLRLGN